MSDASDPMEEELSREYERHREEVRQIAADPNSQWTLNLIAEDERHYSKLLQLIRKKRAAEKKRSQE